MPSESGHRGIFCATGISTNFVCTKNLLDVLIERLQNYINTHRLQVYTTHVSKIITFEDKKKERKPQVRFPHLNLTISKKTRKESPKLVNGNRREKYISAMMKLHSTQAIESCSSAGPRGQTEPRVVAPFNDFTVQRVPALRLVDLQITVRVEAYVGGHRCCYQNLVRVHLLGCKN